MKLTQRLTYIPRLRDLYPRARRNLEARIEQNVKPRIEADVIALLAPYPGPVVYPFQFATALSRRFYFANFTLPYIRLGIMAANWRVNVSALNGGLFSRLVGFVTQQSSGAMIFITVRNDDPAFPYVYGPRQVPGMLETGWGEQLDNNRDEVLINARGYVVEEWQPAVTDAIREG